MLNFTVGPVQMNESVRAMGAEQVPYFRTSEFSSVMLDSERMICGLVNAPEGARAVFLTGSGTASMEAAVMNVLSENDRALVVDGGSFGHRFVQLCDIHGVLHDVIALQPGESLLEEHLRENSRDEHTALIVNMGETSTGVLYDMDLVSKYCKRKNLLLIVDAISTFLADYVDMAAWGADVVIVGSQKGLAVPPGVSAMVFSPDALSRIDASTVKSMYFDLKIALKNGERGQTPFTPAVGILFQIHERLRAVEERGLEEELKRVAELASDFREKIAALPFDRLAENPSNAVTSLKTRGFSASETFRTLKDEYGIWVCPSGGDLAETVLRVGHLGCLSLEDNDVLIGAFEDMRKRGLLGE